MERSEGLANLAAAFTKAQAELPAVRMNTTNKFLGNRYADLGAVIENARPIPQKHGLSISQLVIGSGAAVGIETILRHSSGEYISNRVELELGAEKGKSAAQVAGSTIPYLRRYAYAAAPGMYADEDTDGNAPRPTQDKQAGDKAVQAKQAGEQQAGEQREQAARPKNSKWQRPFEPANLKAAIAKKAESCSQISEMQMKLLRALWTEYFKGRDDERHMVQEYLTGHKSLTEIDGRTAAALLDWLKPERRKDGSGGRGRGAGVDGGKFVEYIT